MIICVLLAAIFFILLFPQFAMFIISTSGETPPKPEIKYAEFPISLQYEINGEIFNVEDIIICRYDGIEFGHDGKYIKWDKKLASTGEKDLLLFSENNKKVFFSVGDAGYYMGEDHKKLPLNPVIYVKEYTDYGTISSSASQYKINIINCKFPEPIKNMFK